MKEMKRKTKIIYQAHALLTVWSRFQYVFCHLEALRSLHSPARVIEALNSLPLGLDETYERILQSIKPEIRVQVANSLKWLASSKRELRLGEVAMAFAVRPDSAVPFHENDMPFADEDILRYLSSLVVTEVRREKSVFPRSLGGSIQETTYVRLAHFSVKEYLMSHRISGTPISSFSFDDIGAHLHIAQSCLALLLHYTCNKTKWNHFELNCYAALNWASHLEMVPRSSWPAEVVDSATRALAAGSPTLRYLVCFTSYPNYVQENFWSQPLLYTVHRKFFQLTEMLLSGTLLSQWTQEHLDTACHEAAYRTNTNFVELLLSKGADIRGKSEGFSSLLHAVCLGFNSRVTNIEPLLDKGADINKQDAMYGSVLQAACRYSGLDFIQLLLERGADVNALGGEYGSALQAVCHFRLGQTEQRINLLLKHGANINAQCGIYGNALQAACYAAYGRCEFIQLLLSHGADINAQGGRFGSALQAACSAAFFNKDVIKLLLERGADVNIKGGVYGNALQAALRIFWNTDLITLLRDEGADINAVTDSEYGTALQTVVCRHSHIEPTLQLLDWGADPNVFGGRYGSALQGACYNQSLDKIQLLLDRGADVHVQGGVFGSAWHATMMRDLLDNRWREIIPILRLLLDRGVDVNDKRGISYVTALQAAVLIPRDGPPGGDEFCTVRFLLDHGADPNLWPDESRTSCPANRLQSRDFSSALQVAVYLGRRDWVRLLLDRDADVNQGGGKYSSALNVAVIQGFWDIFEVLVDAGATLDKQSLPEAEEEWLSWIRKEGAGGAGERYRVVSAETKGVDECS